MFALWNGIRVGVITPRVREYRNDVDLRMVGDNVLRRSTTGRGRSKRQWPHHRFRWRDGCGRLL